VWTGLNTTCHVLLFAHSLLGKTDRLHDTSAFQISSTVSTGRQQNTRRNRDEESRQGRCRPPTNSPIGSGGSTKLKGPQVVKSELFTQLSAVVVLSGLSLGSCVPNLKLKFVSLAVTELLATHKFLRGHVTMATPPFPLFDIQELAAIIDVV